MASCPLCLCHRLRGSIGVVLIAQITDLHIDEPGAFMRRFVDANTKLETAIGYLHARRERPDLVLATGDLTNDGRPEQFRLLKELLERLQIPIYLIPGNHDEREEFRSAFSDRPWMPASGPIDYVIDDYPVRLIGMDTSEPGRHDGTLDDDQLTWLDSTLSATPDQADAVVPPPSAVLERIVAARFNSP